MAENKENNVKIIWIHGSYFKRRKLLEKVYQRFSNSDKFICNSETPFDLLTSEIESCSCFNDHKVIIINELPKVDNKSKKMQALQGILSSLSNGNFVVFNNIDIDSNKSLFDFVDKHGKCYLYESVFNNESASQWVVDYLKENKRNISIDSAEFLITNFGFDESIGDVSRDYVKLLCDTIILYSSKNESISNDEIITCLFESNKNVIWSLFDYFDKKQANESFEFIHKMIYDNDSAIKCAQSILPLLMWRYKMLFFLKETFHSVKDYSKTIDIASSVKKMSQSGSGFKMKMRSDVQKSNAEKSVCLWSGYVLNKAIMGNKNVVEMYTRKELYRIIMILNEISFILRQKPLNSYVALYLDVLVMSVCQSVDDTIITSLRNSLIKSTENNI